MGKVQMFFSTLELKSFGTLYKNNFTIAGVPTFSSPVVWEFMS